MFFLVTFLMLMLLVFYKYLFAKNVSKVRKFVVFFLKKLRVVYCFKKKQQETKFFFKKYVVDHKKLWLLSKSMWLTLRNCICCQKDSFNKFLVTLKIVFAVKKDYS